MPERINRIGQRLSDYQLLRHLGGGGFGDVYLGEHIRTQEQVAIKVLHGRLTGNTEFKEFINEARTMRLKHPHIVSLLDFGVDSDDVPYLVMEYAPHGTLRNRHPKGSRVPLETVVSYVTPLSEALFYAHEQQLIHRDVKPENMLLGSNNQLLLSDFGIATVAQNSQLTHVQSGVEGTLPYMAPEQLQGRPRPASDQYALAVVTYEWLTGVRPFNGTQSELVIQHIMIPPRPLREWVPEIPSAVEAVVLTALAKDPKQRFATVLAFAHALAQAAEQGEMASDSTLVPPLQRPSEETATLASPSGGDVQPEKLSFATIPIRTGIVPSTPGLEKPLAREITPSSDATISPRTPTASSVSLPKRPSRRRFMAVGLALLALLVITTGMLWTMRTINAPSIYAPVPTPNRKATMRAIPTLTAAAQTATITTSISAYDRFVSANGMMFGFDAQHSGYNPFEQILSLDTVTRLQKGWSFSTNGFIKSLPVVANGIVYVGSQDHNLYAVDGATGAQKWSFPTNGWIISTPAVANGVIYVSSEDENLYALDAATGARKWSVLLGGAFFQSSPVVVNNVVYVGSDDDNLYALDAVTGTKKWSFSTGNSIISTPAVANDIVYVGSTDGNLYALDALTGTKKWSLSIGSGIVSSAALANGIVYIGSQDHNLYAVDAVTGAKKWSFPTGDLVNSTPVLANGIVYIGSFDHNLYALDAVTGAKKWSFPTGVFISSTPMVANGIVYLGSEENHRLYALDAATGSKKWSFLIGSIVSSPAVANGIVYVGGSDGWLYTFRLPA